MQGTVSYFGNSVNLPYLQFGANYYPLLNKFQQEISRIQKHYISWSGCLAAYKMQLLPKLTYYFRALLIPLPSSFFTSMQKQLANFVWAGKGARFPSQMQGKYKLAGGLGIPILKDYYIAAILEQLRGWLDKSESKPWCQLEQAWLYPNSPLSLLLAHNIQHTNITIDHPTIQASLNAWTYLKKHLTQLLMSQMLLSKWNPYFG